MPELEKTWKRILSVWWLVLWRGFVGGLLLGVLVGVIVGGTGILLGWGSDVGTRLSGILGSAAGILWSVAVTRMALRKNYRGFRIALLPRHSAETALSS